MEIIIQILIGIAVIILFFDLISIVTFGIVYKNYQKYIDGMKNYSLNEYSSSVMINSYEYPYTSIGYITTVPISIGFFKYYIQGHGCVLKGSKLHKAIEQKIKELQS